ncbi:4-hydroxy-2-oxoglutarate aldolase, mitochondrial-like [Pollicipes pollicipes]|uniref:4-hydroxy-2-oxoglutarate aldolase, mitochondrial-like n=1 Tax=Pollicipes pollicipes TaxID=41117 RepID=UPI0018850B3C|nr:4-hydroxy-2-oxoglutarate aldolase, mitochondrial-like [Pollicipes pollicipes]XP_037092196.1 4-hydroxy-2-oxoglutarate aldolase, mitochondrial-like [Pollicipes pollicipes]XP_037092197.1 4-hydroxy-2-oxoglutarate aldolase, mitochondrial-like [Pollicipes pollicipes]XP_037092198.1 4-hydroxy-2-oxoglutarate aldolase, mitochondrial-like [Pollicipes pollicipes]
MFAARRLVIAAHAQHKSFNFLLKKLHVSAPLSKLDLNGVYPPISTPFTSDGKEQMDFDKLESNLNVYSKSPLRGYLVQGSNGEYVYLSPEERVEMVRRVRRAVPADRLVLAGSGCEATGDTVRLTAQMAEAGADAVVVVTPCYYKSGMTDAAMVAHYTAVADASSVPVVLYSVPANTGVDLSAAAVARLAQHPNIVGIKDSAGDISKLALMVHQTKGENFQVLAGSASFLLPALLVGCVGGICALANVLPAEVCQLQALFEAGRLEEAAALQRRLVAPNAAVTRQLGVPGLKAAMDDHGLYGGPVRAPLLPLPDAERQRLRQVFADAGFQ